MVVGCTGEEFTVAACMEEGCTAVTRSNPKLKMAQPSIQTSSSNLTSEEKCNKQSVSEVLLDGCRWTLSNAWPGIRSGANGQHWYCFIQVVS